MFTKIDKNSSKNAVEIIKGSNNWNSMMKIYRNRKYLVMYRAK